MTNSQRLETVRAAFSVFLTQEPDSRNAPMSESYVIRDEFVCGRRFATPTHLATWFIEEDQLKIHHVDGQRCLSIQGEEIQTLAASVPPDSTAIADHETPSVLPMPSIKSREDENAKEIRRAA